MKLTPLLLTLAACAAETATSTSNLTGAGFVHRDGITLVGNDGAPLVMRGFNLGGWLMWEGWLMGGQLGLDQRNNSETHIAAQLESLLGPAWLADFRERFRDAYITEADIARLADLGFNSVRVPFNHTVAETAAGLAHLDDVIRWGAAHHVYVVLDLHSVPSGQCNEFPDDPEATLVWDRPLAQVQTVALWRQLAARYRDQHWVAGYDLMNEPCHATGDQLRALDQRIVGAIREVDPNHMVIVEGNTMATDFSGFPQLLDPNQSYSFHIYNFLGDPRARQLPKYAALARGQQAPLWAGEFGEASEPYIESTVAMFADPRYAVTAGYALWTYKRAATSNPTLEAVAIPAGWQKTMKWITAPLANPRPTALEAALGATQYLQAVALDRCHEDAVLAAAVRGPE